MAVEITGHNYLFEGCKAHFAQLCANVGRDSLGTKNDVIPIATALLFQTELIAFAATTQGELRVETQCVAVNDTNADDTHRTLPKRLFLRKFSASTSFLRSASLGAAPACGAAAAAAATAAAADAAVGPFAVDFEARACFF